MGVDMSEPAPDTAPSSSGSGVFARKLGPLPMWAWMGIGLAVALGYYYWKQNKSSAAASSTAQTAASTAASGAAGGTDSSLVPQFVNQTYVENQPPTAPAATSTPPATTTPPAAAQVSQYPAPTGAKVTKLTSTSAKVNWNYLNSPTPKPQSYTVAAYTTSGKLAQYLTVASPDTASGQGQATLTGLKSGTTYNVQVWANGGKVAPPGATVKLSLLCRAALANR
jgi:hypothetical protein